MQEDTHDPFILECLDAGFVRDTERWITKYGPPFTVRCNWVRWIDGTLWLAIPGTRKLTMQSMGYEGCVRDLRDFVAIKDAGTPLEPKLSAPRQRSLFE